MDAAEEIGPASGCRQYVLRYVRWTNLGASGRRGQHVGADGVEKLPKNGKTRTVTVLPIALDALRLVPARIDSPYLLHTSCGKRLTKGMLNYLWRPIVAAWRAQGGRPITLYYLRRACATLLLERGLIPSEVAMQLGSPMAAGWCRRSTGIPQKTGHGSASRSRLLPAPVVVAGPEARAPGLTLGVSRITAQPREREHSYRPAPAIGANLISPYASAVRSKIV